MTKVTIQGRPADEIKLLRDLVVVQQDGYENTTKSGIHVDIVNWDKNRKPSRGKVINISPDVSLVKKGDHIIFSKYAGIFFRYKDREDLLLLSESEIEAIVPEELKSNINVGDTPFYKRT